MPSTKVQWSKFRLHTLAKNLGGHNGKIIHGRGTANAVKIVFWHHMDKEYLDYNALSRSAIADVKSLDRKDSRFLQMMKVKLTTHRKNLEINNMGHCITSA